MTANTRLVKQFALIAIPAITGCTLISLPSIAATLGTSKATVELNNFSHNPLNIFTITDTDTTTITTDGQADATAKADAVFTTHPTAQASNISLSKTKGEGNGYSSFAQSYAGLIGYNFNIGANETFQFDFNTFLNLETSIDTPSYESASSRGSLFFNLYTNEDLNNPIDSFNLFASIDTLGNNEWGGQSSQGFQVNSQQIGLDFDGNQESFWSSIEGQYSRQFDQDVSLFLVEGKYNEAYVEAVPEPTTVLGSVLFGLFGLGCKLKKKTALRSK